MRDMSSALDGVQRSERGRHGVFCPIVWRKRKELEEKAVRPASWRVYVAATSVRNK